MKFPVLWLSSVKVLAGPHQLIAAKKKNLNLLNQEPITLLAQSNKRQTKTDNRENSLSPLFRFTESRVDAVVGALAFHQRGLGLIP